MAGIIEKEQIVIASDMKVDESGGWAIFFLFMCDVNCYCWLVLMYSINTESQDVVAFIGHKYTFSLENVRFDFELHIPSNMSYSCFGAWGIFQHIENRLSHYLLEQKFGSCV